MDKICIWLEKLILWVDRCGPPRVMWVGQSWGRFHNPPAPHIEIVLALEGACPVLYVGDQKVSLRAGEVSLHSVHFGNKSPPNAHFKVWCLFLDVGGDREFRSLEKAPLFCSMHLSRRTEIEAAFAALAARCYRYGSGPEKGYLDQRPLFMPGRIPANVPSLLVKNVLMDLLVLLLEDGRHGSKISAVPLPVPILNSMEFMATRLSVPATTLEDIARASGLSVDHFGRLFHQQVGITPMRWLQRLRIQQSRFLLERTSLFVEEVAGQTGFSDPFHFSRIFRKLVGLNPSEYRKKHAGRGGM